ncbi:MAG: FAD-dependent oxidoreductase [Sedimentibacter sp.]|uniref:FAD-dependent oxidoreductase n=1 Tax=Sedimentibacter sp. TaxID=1960295 RepID=UPI0031582E3C
MKCFKRYLSLLMVAVMLLTVAGCASTPVKEAVAEGKTTIFTPGTYKGTGDGNGGKFTVDVTFSEKSIDEIVIGENKETEGVANNAFDRIPKSIIENQSIGVDTVSGATITSKAILQAVEDAIVQAGGKPEDFKKPQVKKAGMIEEYTADIAIVGAGGSGTTAAVEAARNGASVIMIEKNSYPGGISSFGAGIGGVESSYQKEAGLTFTSDEVYEHMLNYTNATVYAPLLRRIIELSGETIDWLSSDEFKLDISVITPNIWKGEVYDTYHLIYPYGPDRFGPLIDDFVGNGGTLMLETEGKSLIKEGDRVVGVKAVKSDGTEVIIHSDAVIVATGGALANKEMLVEYTGTAEYAMMQPSVSDGAGIRMSVEAGAATTNELFVEVSEIGMTPGIAEKTKFNINLLSVAGLLHVNASGTRYFNEGLFKEQPLNVGGASASSTSPYYVIFDQATVDKMIEGGLKALLPEEGSEDLKEQLDRLSFFGSTSGVPPMFAGAAYPLDNLSYELEEGIKGGYVWKADSIEELAKVTDLNNLTSTVTRYKELVDARHDEDLLKKDIYLTEISTGPYYAVKYLPGAFNTLGGVMVNENLQALDANSKPITGLYVAGVDGGSMFHKPYYDICGTSMMYAFNSGRIAGKEASKFVGK